MIIIIIIINRMDIEDLVVGEKRLARNKDDVRMTRVKRINADACGDSIIPG